MATTGTAAQRHKPGRPAGGNTAVVAAPSASATPHGSNTNNNYVVASGIAASTANAYKFNSTDVEKRVMDTFETYSKEIEFALSLLDPLQFGKMRDVPRGIEVQAVYSSAANERMAAIDGHLAIAFGHGVTQSEDNIRAGKLSQFLVKFVMQGAPITEAAFNYFCADEEFNGDEFDEFVKIVQEIAPWNIPSEAEAPEAEVRQLRGDRMVTSIKSMPIALFAALSVTDALPAFSDTTFVYRAAFKILLDQLSAVGALILLGSTTAAAFLQHKLITNTRLWSQLCLAVRARGGQYFLPSTAGHTPKEHIYLGLPMRALFGQTQTLRYVFEFLLSVMFDRSVSPRVSPYSLSLKDKYTEEKLRSQYVSHVVRSVPDQDKSFGNWPIYMIDRQRERDAIAQGKQIEFWSMNSEMLNMRYNRAASTRARILEDAKVTAERAQQAQIQAQAQLDAQQAAQAHVQAQVHTQLQNLSSVMAGVGVGAPLVQTQAPQQLLVPVVQQQPAAPVAQAAAPLQVGAPVPPPAQPSASQQPPKSISIGGLITPEMGGPVVTTSSGATPQAPAATNINSSSSRVNTRSHQPIPSDADPSFD